MKKMGKLLALLLALLMVLTACSQAKPETQTPAAQPSQTAAEEEKQPQQPAEEEAPVSTEFVPKLDTEQEVELTAAVFFGNFSAFDQVINHFNEFYPNVVITYDQVTDSSTEEFLQDNPVDIFMVSTERGYFAPNCVDLLAAGVDFGDVADGMLKSNTFDGKVLALPMGLNLTGIVVNETLLENEGIAVPQTWQEFLDAMETLKQKGYTPLQGPTEVISRLILGMGMNMMNNDPALLQAVNEGDAAGAAALESVYARLLEIQEKGYISDEVNAEYPADNYDGAIMKFLEGNVPFWVCDTEKVSGMKKRESKSEAFSANPFEYEFMFAPTGDTGVSEYFDPWYAFAVNKDCENVDYAVEFLRFMAREDELNTLASVKGVPSIAKNATDERYVNLNRIEKVDSVAVSDGTVPGYYATLLCNTGNELLRGELADADAAVEAFVTRCAESLQEAE